MKATLSILLLLALGSVLLLIPYTPTLATKVAAQFNNNANTNLVKAVREASQNGTEYLKAKISIRGLVLSAEIPTTTELMEKGLAVKNELKEMNQCFLYLKNLRDIHFG